MDLVQSVDDVVSLGRWWKFAKDLSSAFPVVDSSPLSVVRGDLVSGCSALCRDLPEVNRWIFGDRKGWVLK